MDIGIMFNKYCEGTDVLKGRMFIKMFKDSGIVSTSDQTNKLDLIFTKYKSKSPGIQYEDFLKSLDDVSRMTGYNISEIKNKLIVLKGPIYRGTETVPVRFYDDKSLFTGVHLHGGPSIVDSPKKNKSI